MKYKIFTFFTILFLTSTAFSVQANYAEDKGTDSMQNIMVQDDTYSTDENAIIQEKKINAIENSVILDSNDQSPFNRQPERLTQRQELPVGYTFWSDLEVDANIIFDRYYAADAIIKIYQNDRVELLIKTNGKNIPVDVQPLMQMYNVKIVKYYDLLQAFTVSVPLYKMEGFVTALKAMNNILYVEPSFYVSTSFVPNDPEWGNQWGPQIIGMETAWDYNMGSTDVLVAIIDTGIDYNHPDLGNYLPLGYDWVNNDNDPMDDAGHGTHVAGTIAASINDGYGVAGVANVSFFAEKFLDSNGFGSYTDGANAIIHAVDAGADILSNSWGGYGDSSILADAVQYALDAGVFVVAASGNGATNAPHYPSAYPGVISVGATDVNDQLAYFSNYGETLEITAPGVNVISTLPGNSYGYYDGTSMATPHVSGALALLKSSFPSYSNELIENLLYSSTVDLGEPGWDQYFGYGRLDVATAIFGVQDHDLLARVNVPSVVQENSPVTINVMIMNNGLYNESYFNYTLGVDNTTLVSDMVTFLGSGESFEFAIDYLPPGLGEYTINLDVQIVPGENITNNNHVQKIFLVSTPIIDPNTRDQMVYGGTHIDGVPSSIPFGNKFVVEDASDATNVIINWYIFDEYMQQEYLLETFSVNSITRECSLWDYFPYWIDPTLQVGDTFPLFSTTENATVIGETTFEYYGQTIDVLIVDDSFELVFFSKNDGVLFTLADYNYDPYFYGYSMIYTNRVPSGFLENTYTEFSMSMVYGGLNETTEIPYLIWNTGLSSVNTTVQIIVDKEIIIDTVNLASGEYLFESVYYNASQFGMLNASLYTFEVPGESFLDDNFDFTTVNIVDIQNYIMTNPSYTWYDAMSNGDNLNLYGDDTYASINMPFTFNFYGVDFNTLYVSSNGWLSFGEETPYSFYTEPFPTYDHPFAIAPFFADLVAENNLYVWMTNSFVVVEFYSYHYLSGDFAGTFEVIFFDNGDMLFQYQTMGPDYSNTRGLNYGLNLAFYSVVDQDLSYTSEFAVLFSLNGSGGNGDVLETQMSFVDVEENQSTFIFVWVTNVGTQDAMDVLLYLYINDEIKSAMYTQVLPVGENLTLVYYWQNVQAGEYVIMAVSPAANGETFLENNVATQNVSVGFKHDLEVLLDIYFDGSVYVFTVIVSNLGDFDETFVLVELLIDGVSVNLGFISYLGTGTFSAIGYWWYDFSEGTHLIEAQVYPVLDEENLDNNYISELLDIYPQDEVTINFYLFDNDNGSSLEGVEIFLYNYDTNFSYLGWTDQYGSLVASVPIGYYYLSAYLDGYKLDENEFYLGAGTYDYYIYLVPEPVTGFTTVNFYLLDNETGSVISNADVYLFNSNTGDFYEGITDAYGYISFYIITGEYIVDIYKEGYISYHSYDYFTAPDSIYDYYIVMLPWGSQGTAFVHFTILDELGNPVSGAIIDIYGSNTGEYHYLQTDVNGSVSVEVGVDWYNININTNEYYYFYAFEEINVVGQDYYFVYYLQPLPDANIPVYFYVYDNATGSPITNAYIYMWNSDTHQTYQFFTDMNGEFFGNVTPGYYYINIIAQGYISIEFDTMIDNPNVLNEFWIALIDDSTLPDVTIYFNIYSVNESIGIADVEIQLYSFTVGRYFYFYTDSNGFVEAIVPIGEYQITISKPGWSTIVDSLLVDIPGELYKQDYYLSQIPDRMMNILSPGYGDSVEGGVVYVQFDVEDLPMLDHIDIYDNGVFLTVVYPSSYELLLPILSNGTHFFEFVASYQDGGQAFANLEINSFNVVATLDLDVGDYFDYEILFLGNPNRTTIYEFYVMEWVSEYEVYINLNISSVVDGQIQNVITYYLVVNVLNGYISDADSNWIYAHFFMIGNYDTVSTLGVSAFIGWADVYHVVGEDTWNNQSTWVMENVYGYSMRILKSNGLMTDFVYPNAIIGTLLDSSIIPVVNVVPVFRFEPRNFSYELGSSNNTAYWLLQDDDPSFFEYFLDDVLIVSGNWTSDDGIYLDFDGLDVGIHSVVLIFYDISGNSVQSEIAITVVDTTIPTLSTVDDLTIFENESITITWQISDLKPGNYTILLNGSLLVNDLWEREITLSIGPISSGIYLVELYVYDFSSNMVSDDFLLTVNTLPDTEAPSIRGMPDFTYEENSTNNVIVWEIKNDNVGTFEITMDNELFNGGDWSGDEISINIDGLNPGRYEFVLTIYDDAGNSASDEVVVYVISEKLQDKIDDIPSHKAPGFELYLAIFALLGTIGIVFKRRMKN